MVRQSRVKCFRACVQIQGAHFEHLLWSKANTVCVEVTRYYSKTRSNKVYVYTSFFIIIIIFMYRIYRRSSSPKLHNTLYIYIYKKRFFFKLYIIDNLTKRKYYITMCFMYPFFQKKKNKKMLDIQTILTLYILEYKYIIFNL